LDTLEEYKADCNPDLIIESIPDKKCIIIEDQARGNLKLKLKMYKDKDSEDDNDDDSKLRLRFIKKAGTL